MSEAQQPQMPPIHIRHQYIRDLSMEIPHAPEIFKTAIAEPKVEISVDLNSRPIEGNLHCVELTFHVEGDVPESKLFVLELSYGCVVELNVPQEHINPVLMVEVPHLIFPYARQIIGTVTSNGGLPPLMLTPIDFLGLYQARLQQQAAQQGQ